MFLKYMTITELLKKEYDYLSKSYEVYGIFLYGSQNYGLATGQSDLDTKAIIIPSFEDLVLKQPINKVLDFGCGKCDVKDVREMVKNYKKQNVNFVETLYTVYFYINPKYEKFHHELLQERGRIARIDEKKALDCLKGHFEQAKKRMTHVTDTTKSDIDKYGYHRKSLLSIMRIASMIDKYTKGNMYSKVLDCSSLRKYQQTEIPKATAFASVAKYDKFITETINKYITEKHPQPDEKAIQWLDYWMLRVIYSNMKEPSKYNIVMRKYESN